MEFFKKKHKILQSSTEIWEQKKKKRNQELGFKNLI